MANIDGQSYAFAALTPILTGSTQGVIHVAELRSVLARLNAESPSPITKVPGTHFLRWNIIDTMPQLGFPTREDPLKSKYLLLETDFDGDRDAWIDGFATAVPDLITAIYRHCAGFPGLNDPATFRQYLVAAQLDTTLDFAPYSTQSLDRVLRALETQRRFVVFARQAQGRPDAEVRVAFSQFVEQLRDMPTPPPGTL
ncbi:MAG: hypothetical protein HUU26_01130 [Gemmatimonadaceae bacterium]|nr:hypothetical protein [Gemmatimonadaceae bacterium]